MNPMNSSRLYFLLVLFVAGTVSADVAELANQPWIGDGKSLATDAVWYEDDPASSFQAEFVLPEEMVSGRKADTVDCWLATPGYARVEVNGKLAQGRMRDPLIPIWSPVEKTIYAERLALNRNLLKNPPETNVVTVTLGNGWYGMPPLTFWGRHKFQEQLPHGRPCFKLAVDGVTNLVWRWRATDIVQNSIQLGAKVDRTQVADTHWKRAEAVAGPAGRIVPRQAPPVVRSGLLVGRTTWLRKHDVAVVDFGENATGIPTFSFPKTLPGQRVEILYGERLNTNGTVNVLTQTAGQIKRGNGGPGAPAVAAQRDELICRGGDLERFSPPFTWHVGRYAEIRGIEELPSLAVLEKVVSAVEPVEPGRSYLPSEGDFLRIHEMCRRTFLANLVGVQSDCPGRERLGYGGDIVATCEAYMMNFDMREFYLKTLQDFADEAADDGWLTETAPYVGIAARGFGGRSGPISWTVVVPVLMDAILRHYGDRRALAYYPVCTRYVDLVEAHCPDGIVPRCIGDHETLDRVPDEVTATAHWHEFVRLTAKFARLLGKDDEAARFEVLSEKIARVFSDRFVKEGVVANGTQSAQAIGLYLGLVPADQVAAAEARLIRALEEKDFAPTTGIFATRYLLMYLSERGHVDLARRIVLHRGFPGWLNMLEHGATTLWETWKESDDVYSNCHPMFGSVDEWLLRFAR